MDVKTNSKAVQKYMSILPIAAPLWNSLQQNQIPRSDCSGYENTILQNFMKRLLMAASLLYSQMDKKGQLMTQFVYYIQPN